MAQEFTATPEEVEKVRQKVKANVPASVVKMGKMVDAYWEDIRRAPQEGKKVAWQVSAPGAILTQAAGMPTLFQAAFAPYCTARRWEGPLLQIANEDFGFLPDTCSYIRLHSGLIHAWDTGQLDKIRPELRIPRPDLVVCGRTCNEHSTLAELVARHANCPMVLLDDIAMGCVTEADYRKRAKFMERQMREDVIPAIEKATGRPYPYDKLSEMLSVVKQVAILRDEVTELMKNKPSPCTMFDLGISLLPLIAQMGRPEAVTYFKEFLDECKDRAAKGIGVLPEEKYRLYWDGYTTWSVLGTVMRMLAPRGGIPLAGRYTWSFWLHPEMLDPEKPLESIAYSLVRYMIPPAHPYFAKDMIMELIEDYQLDGCIMLSYVTCRMFNVGQEEFAEMAERKFGIPSLIFPCDMVDRTHVNEAQLNTRVEAFLEMIDARRRKY